MSPQLDKGVAIDEIDIKLRLSLLKPLHAECLVDFYNHMTSSAAKKKLLIVYGLRLVLKTL